MVKYKDIIRNFRTINFAEKRAKNAENEELKYPRN